MTPQQAHVVVRHTYTHSTTSRGNFGLSQHYPFQVHSNALPSGVEAIYPSILSPYCKPYSYADTMNFLKDLSIDKIQNLAEDA
jgi:hypothetical protein